MTALRTDVHQLLGVMGDIFMIVAAGLVIVELVRHARFRSNRGRLIELAIALGVAGVMVQNPFLPAQLVNAILGLLGVSTSPPP